ncbi:DUF2861 family protein [Aeromonas veronii]|nr:DUF2861 family protein [Aeromonas veronii]MBE8741364.1 DUF2861 family protein [Aeromonas veronii]MBE8745758.1 DUF2861 family protein [Aeromonas veronii]MBE8765682.1 DUF2861 family protein [Aeromonas veronii]MBE8841524.1 DUF2861 family protein [Aeromonas veronii]
MKRATLAGLLLALSCGLLNLGLLNVSSVMATDRLLEADRADPLQPATLALLQGDNRHAWQSLQQAWPALTSNAERRSWQGMLAALSAQHCGKDFPLTLPDGVSELRLELIQRDAPLLRDYRVQLTGEGPITAAELIDPAGRDRLVGAQWEAEENSGVRVVGADLPTPLPAGLYQLRLTVAGKEWQVALPLPAVQDLDWLSRSPQAVANPPVNPASCTPLWLEQTVLARPQYSLLWWNRLPLDGKVGWPAATADSWRTLSLVQTSQRGHLVLQLSHSQAGPVE